MYQRTNTKPLPLLAAAMGFVGMGLRWALYAFCMDEKSLLPVNHPVEIALWILTAAALALIAVLSWKRDGSSSYADNFTASPLAAVGTIAAGIGILLTVLLNAPLLNNRLGVAWKLLGLLSFPCLLAAGYKRYQGKQPFFVLPIIPCLFLVMHIINHYQRWSGNPQLQDYVFTLFGTMALMFFCFYTTAFAVDSGRRRMYLGMGSAAVYLCLVSLPEGNCLYLYAGGIFWVLCELWSLRTKPKAKNNPGAQSPSEGA